jgi:leucyl/phenylalanyl-tRNA--protein transferase
MIPWLRSGDPFPPLERALEEPNGLLAAGADLSVERLVGAYERGIFPWYSDGQPILWWSPDPRMVLSPDSLKIPRSLRKRLARRDYEVTADAAFEDVIRGCAAPRREHDGTWITDDMLAAYVGLHRAGYAHSIETWVGGRLAGGLYGVALGRMYYGESMFTRVPDASKIALVHLARHLERSGFGLIDCQMATAHLARFGAREIPRAAFVLKLKELVNYPRSTRKWRLDDDLLD